MPPSSSVARGGAGVVPGDERAATSMIGENLREPAGLRRALTAATEVGRDGARHVVALAAVAVQHHRVPRTDLEAVIALERLSARPAEIGPERSCVRRVVLVVSDHGVGDRPEASPGRRVAVEVLVERPVRVDEVSERQHLRAACAVDQVPGSDEEGMILQRRRRRRGGESGALPVAAFAAFVARHRRRLSGPQGPMGGSVLGDGGYAVTERSLCHAFRGSLLRIPPERPLRSWAVMPSSFSALNILAAGLVAASVGFLAPLQRGRRSDRLSVRCLRAEQHGRDCEGPRGHAGRP